MARLLKRLQRAILFENLTPLYPNKRIVMETTKENTLNPGARSGSSDRKRPAGLDRRSSTYR